MTRLLLFVFFFVKVFCDSNGSRVFQRFSNPVPVCIGTFTLYPNGVTVCDRDSSGQTRQANEIDCKFPFEYKGQLFDSCIAMDRQFYWCSTDSVFQNKFAVCQQECPLLARTLVERYPGAIHSACLPRSPVAVSLVPSQAEMQTILGAHNYLRSVVNPTSADMKALSWDFSLARLAQKKADSCDFGHDCQGCRNLLNNRAIQIGQNAYANLGGQYDANFWQNVIYALIRTESQNFVYGYGSKTGNYENVAHYTQIISSNSMQIGCGASKCGSYLYAYCNIASVQTSTTFPYTSGAPCSQCNPQLCSNNLCNCNKLCLNYGVLDPMSCQCRCQPYATGEFCERLVCDRSDQQYGCLGTNPMYCVYANTVQACPSMCGICRI